MPCSVPSYNNSYPTHPPHLTLSLFETSLVTGLVRFAQIESKQWGGVEILKMAYAHHPKATVMCDPSWQETWKLSVLYVPLPSQLEVCL